MKLSEIESVGEVVLVKEPAWSTVQANLNQFCDLKDGDLLYTKKAAQEYAKECVKAALKILDNTILPIFEDDERVVMQKIFGEDTKND